MNRNRFGRLMIVIPLMALIVFFYYNSMSRKMKTIREEVKTEMDLQNRVYLSLAMNDIHGESHWFALGEPLPVSRIVGFGAEGRSPNAFGLPLPERKTLENPGVFVADVERGGSCNVSLLEYCPHGVTHMETSAHVLGASARPPQVRDIPAGFLSGTVFLMDLSADPGKPGSLIAWETVRAKLETITFPITILAIKTHASLLEESYDFSGKNFTALSPEAAKGIHDYLFPPKGSGGKAPETRINCLILDLPSIDPEQDGGKLAAHRCFFGLPESGFAAEDGEKRALVELARFAGLAEGYYHAEIVPALFGAEAVAVGVVFRPLLGLKK